MLEYLFVWLGPRYSQGWLRCDINSQTMCVLNARWESLCEIDVALNSLLLQQLLHTFGECVACLGLVLHTARYTHGWL